MVNVSVIITVWKRYNFIGDAIVSVFKQSLKPKEIIVVADDPDRVPYKDRVYVIEERNRKLGARILKGIDASSSELIALLEDDDAFHPDKLRIVTKLFEKLHNRVLAIHNLQINVDIHGNYLNNPPWGQPDFELLLSRHNILKWIRIYPEIYHNNSSLTLRREVFERHREIIKNIELALDFALFILSVNDGFYLHIPERLTFYRIGSGISTMDLSSDPVNIKHHICRTIRNAYDKYILYNYFEERGNIIKRLVKKYVIGYLPAYVLYSSLIDCGVKIPLSRSEMLKMILISNGDMHELQNSMRALLLMILSTISREKLLEFIIRRKYGINLKSLINSNLEKSFS